MAIAFAGVRYSWEWQTQRVTKLFLVWRKATKWRYPATSISRPAPWFAYPKRNEDQVVPSMDPSNASGSARAGDLSRRSQRTDVNPMNYARKGIAAGFLGVAMLVGAITSLAQGSSELTLTQAVSLAV